MVHYTWVEMEDLTALIPTFKFKKENIKKLCPCETWKKVKIDKAYGPYGMLF